MNSTGQVVADKYLLLADADPQAADHFRQILGPSYTITPVFTGTQALAELKKRPYDAMVADLALPELDGVELLNQVRKDYPKTIRIILSEETDKEGVMKQALGAHQLLAKGAPPATLKTTIENALIQEAWIPNEELRELVGRIRSFPTLPSIYLEVTNALKSPMVSTEQVGAIIAKDMAMMTKLLRVINSSYFGLSRKITDPGEAVSILGFEMVKSMVMTIQFLSHYDKVKPVYFSIDRLWRHSTTVANIARKMVLLHTRDLSLAENAFTAGLMHDLGKIVLATNFEQQYSGVQALALKQKTSLWQIEKMVFGAGHGEIGAYLLGLWGMPQEMIEATALHHEPSRSPVTELTPLAAVHAANVAAHELSPDEEGFLPPVVDTDYLARIGHASLLDDWRGTIGSGNPNSTESSIIITKPATFEPEMLEEASSGTPPPNPLDSPRTVWNGWWRYAAAGSGLLLVILAVGLSQFMVNDPGANPEVAEEDLVQQDASSEPAVSPPETVQPVSFDRTESDEATQRMMAPALKENPDFTATRSAEQLFHELKLQGIMYSSSHPLAIINGRVVRPKERIAGVTIMEIQPSRVVVEAQNQQKELLLQ